MLFQGECEWCSTLPSRKILHAINFKEPIQKLKKTIKFNKKSGKQRISNDIPDYDENDDDGDGIPDDEEGDEDGDGVPDYLDQDDDGDGVADHLDNDDDGDGIPDDEEGDEDGDGVSDYLDHDDNGMVHLKCT